REEASCKRSEASVSFDTGGLRILVTIVPSIGLACASAETVTHAVRTNARIFSPRRPIGRLRRDCAGPMPPVAAAGAAGFDGLALSGFRRVFAFHSSSCDGSTRGIGM